MLGQPTLHLWCQPLLNMNSNLNCSSCMTIKRSTFFLGFSVKFLFQLIYTYYRDANHPTFCEFTLNFQWGNLPSDLLIVILLFNSDLFKIRKYFICCAITGLFLFFDSKDALKTNESFATFKRFNDFNKQISGFFVSSKEKVLRVLFNMTTP